MTRAKRDTRGALFFHRNLTLTQRTWRRRKKKSQTDVIKRNPIQLLKILAKVELPPSHNSSQSGNKSGKFFGAHQRGGIDTDRILWLYRTLGNPPFESYRRTATRWFLQTLFLFLLICIARCSSRPPVRRAEISTSELCAISDINRRGTLVM